MICCIVFCIVSADYVCQIWLYDYEYD